MGKKYRTCEIRLVCFVILFLFIIIGFLFTPGSANSAEAPKLFFSDLESGPKTGWEGSATKGAAVTVWGKNFGATRGSSYITVNGAQLTNDSDYAEWGTSGTANGLPQRLERSTFYLKSTMNDGAGTISVTVGGVTSNTLPFTIRSGTIYFVATSDGSDSYNGLYSTRTGHSGSDGPWKSISKATGVSEGSTLYVRHGTYTSGATWNDPSRESQGVCTANFPCALIGYPGETVTMQSTLAKSNYNHNMDYWTFSKFKFTSSVAISMNGWHLKITGLWLYHISSTAWTGTLASGWGSYINIYGCYFDHMGSDRFYHMIYPGCNFAGPTETCSHYDIAWNEFINTNSESRGGIIDIRTGCYGSCGGAGDDYKIHDNYFHDSNDESIYLGSEGGPVTNVQFYNNIMYNMTGSESEGPSNIYLCGTGGTTYNFYNNTFSNARGFYTPSGFNCPRETYVNAANNIYSSVNSGSSILAGANPNSFTSTNDLYYNAGVPTGSGVTVTGNKSGDPLFVSDGSDFHLQSGSPARDAGTSAVGSTVKKDYDYNPRPQDSIYDIGAYEYIGEYFPPPPDNTPPSIPANLTAIAISSSQINLSWSASTDNVGVAGYKIYRVGTQIGTSATNLYSDTGLNPLTTYSYTVSAFDAAGNESTQSELVSATTPEAPVEMIIDNADLVFTNTGSWWTSGYPNPYATNSLASDINRTSTTATATWTPNIIQHGTYKVYAWWTAGEGRINDAKYTVTHAKGKDTITVNQKQDGGQWNYLGTFEFLAGSNGNVSISNYSQDPNYVSSKISDSVCADAIKFVINNDIPSPPINLRIQ